MANELWNGLGDAVADVREKYEEAVFGRAVTDRESAPGWPQAQEQEASFGSRTHEMDVGPTHGQVQENANYREAAMERDANGPQWPQAEQGPNQGRDERNAPDHDIDR